MKSLHVPFHKKSNTALGTALLCLAIGGAIPTATSIGQTVQTPNAYNEPFTTFESGQVRPLALTPDKKLLLATNTPDAKLEIFKIKPHGLDHVVSVPVGLEPVAVAALHNNEAWVVNHLSDSVSIVKLDGKTSHVVRTLLVGDEPRDIVFAGYAHHKRAFITTAHRGQNNPNDPQLTTPGVGRADVWVFDAEDQNNDSLGGEPLTVITLFADTPRALAVTPDGTTVYAASFHSGNATASTFVASLAAFTTLIPLFPLVNALGEQAPPTEVIAKYDGTHWRDETGQIRDAELPFTLPDKDVFVINATTNPPRQVAGNAGFYAHVGTTLFNMIVNPANGKVYVSNLDANNQQRFEGANNFGAAFTQPDPSVRGQLAFSRITVLDPSGGVHPRHLNKHIDYDTCCAPIPNAENATSVAFPLDMAITHDGQTLYVAALGSSAIAVYNTAQLENDTFVPDVAKQIPVSGGGPTGLALDEDENRLYVLTRFDNAIAIINTYTRTEISKVAMYNPEPPHVIAGRRFLYDASFTSSHGDSACFSCHIFGDTDHLAWNLGNPDQPTIPDPNVYVNSSFRKVFHSMKGVMATQSLRGMDNHGPMHWRGDRTGALQASSAQPNAGAFNENAAFMAFNVAFEGLLGRHAPLTNAHMQAFTRFALEIMYPPNPIRNLDNSLTPHQQFGKDIFFGPRTFFDPFGPSLPCNDCHVLNPLANAGSTTKPGFFGTDGRSADVMALQNVKTPHLRNVYQKVGKFGFPISPVFLSSPTSGVFQGEQIRGYGYSHSAADDTLLTFVFAPNFADVSPLPPLFGPPIVNPEGMPLDAAGLAMRRALEAFMLAFDSNHAPIVGQQVTLTEDNKDNANPRVDLLIARANAGECDLIARAAEKNEGFLYRNGVFLRNTSRKPALTDAALRHRAMEDGGVTYTCTPTGNGIRLALDRNLNGILDDDE